MNLIEKYILPQEMNTHKLLAYALDANLSLNNIDTMQRKKLLESLTEKMLIHPDILKDFISQTENIFMLLANDFSSNPVIEFSMKLLLEKQPDFFDKLDRMMLTDYEERELYSAFIKNYFDLLEKPNPIFTPYLDKMKTMMIEYELSTSSTTPLLFDSEIRQGLFLKLNEVKNSFIHEIGNLYGDAYPFVKKAYDNNAFDRVLLECYLPEIKQITDSLENYLNEEDIKPLYHKMIAFYLAKTHNKINVDSQKPVQVMNFVLSLITRLGIDVNKTPIFFQEKDGLYIGRTFSDLMCVQQNPTDLTYFLKTGLLSKEGLKNSILTVFLDKLKPSGLLFALKNLDLTDDEKLTLFIQPHYQNTIFKDEEIKELLEYFPKTKNNNKNFNHSFLYHAIKTKDPVLKKKAIECIDSLFDIKPSDLDLIGFDEKLEPLYFNAINTMVDKETFMKKNGFPVKDELFITPGVDNLFRTLIKLPNEEGRLKLINLIHQSPFNVDKNNFHKKILSLATYHSSSSDFEALFKTLLKSNFNINTVLMEIIQSLKPTEGKLFLTLITNIKPLCIKHNVFINYFDVSFNARTYQQKALDTIQKINSEVQKERFKTMQPSLDGFNQALQGRRAFLMGK